MLRAAAALEVVRRGSQYASGIGQAADHQAGVRLTVTGAQGDVDVVVNDVVVAVLGHDIQAYIRVLLLELGHQRQDMLQAQG